MGKEVRKTSDPPEVIKETVVEPTKVKTPVVMTIPKSVPKTQIPIEPEPVSKQSKPVDIEDHFKQEIDDREEREEEMIKTIKSDVEAAQRSPFAFTVIMGLSGGVLVIMLFIII